MYQQEMYMFQYSAQQHTTTVTSEPHAKCEFSIESSTSNYYGEVVKKIVSSFCFKLHHLKPIKGGVGKLP